VSIAPPISAEGFSYWGLRRGMATHDLARFNLSAGDARSFPCCRRYCGSIGGEDHCVPWSAPPWMKSNGSYVAGRLKPEFYSEYAGTSWEYVKEMRGMAFMSAR